MSKREKCAVCLRATSVCICGLVQKVPNILELMILQHPQEVTESKNTARLLHLCLNNSQIHCGERFDDAFFETLKAKPALNVLLYPATPEADSLGIYNAPILTADQLNRLQEEQNQPQIRLWVLDATWRKSRKMLYLNPWLQTLPRLSLQDCPPSLYEIRKAEGQHQLSTLEACVYALRQLEDNQVDYTPVLDAFCQFIRMQKSFIPPKNPQE